MRCKVGVWNESIANGDLMSGSFVGLRLARVERACTVRKSLAQVEQYPDETAARRTVVGIIRGAERALFAPSMVSTELS
jgi:hypothetical protein